MNHSNDENITYPPTQKSPDPVRDYIFEVVILILGITSIINVTLLLFFPLPRQILGILFIFDSFLAITFIGDFLRNIYYATSRLDYLKWGWMDLISGIPFFPLLRYMHIRRIVEGIQLLRRTRPREIVRQYRLHRIESLFLSSILICIFVILFSSILIHNVESNALDGNIVTGEDALWWALVTIATVGYGDLYPVTSYGRFLASLMIIFGVALFGVMTSFIATKFLRFGKQNPIKEIIELKEELTDIKSTLIRIEEQIAKTSSSENRSSSNDET